MYRWLLLLLFFYLVYKYANYLIGLFSSQGSSDGGSFKKNSEDPKINVKHNPNESSKNFDEGEYIDFEEVKD
ncbi:MAG: hypothetical protein WD048_12935 [Chitinophagales bacterium]